MGNYVDRTDVRRRLRRNYEALYSVDGAVDTDVLDDDIEAAEGQVDGYLGQRYVVPITDASALRLVKAWALSLVEEQAYNVPGRKLPTNVEQRVKRAHAQLAKAAEGDLGLGAPEVPTERSAATETMIVEGNTPEMERADLKGW